MGQLLRAISKNGGVACYVAQTTDVVARAEQIHTTSAVVTAALGRLLTVGLLVESELIAHNTHTSFPLSAKSETL